MTTIVVAVGHGGAIGRGGEIPWHAPEDLAHFKAATMGHTLIMGSRTWDSIGRPLPGRRTIVVSRRRPALPDGVRLADDPDAALDVALAEDPSPCVVGGEQIYRALLPRVDTVLLTEVDVAVEGADAFFTLDEAAWTELDRRPGDDDRLLFRVLSRHEADGTVGT